MPSNSSKGLCSGNKIRQWQLENSFIRLPWDLPEVFGYWNTVYKRFNEWARKKKLIRIFKFLSRDTDLEWEFVDGSIVKAHQHGSGGGEPKNQAIGKSKGGNTTKIHMCADAFGLPIDFELTGGEVHDVKAAPGFIDRLPTGGYVIADKGYDSEELRQRIIEKKSIPVIPRKSNSTIGNSDMDWGLYKYRHLVENLFARLKHFRAIATRYDKLKRNYKAMLALPCSFFGYLCETSTAPSINQKHGISKQLLMGLLGPISLPTMVTT